MLRKVFYVIMIIFGLGVAYYCYAWLLTPPFSLTTVVEIEAPLEKTFRIFNDHSLKDQWMHTPTMKFKSMDLTSGDPNATGSTYQLVVIENDQELAMTQTITAFEPNKRVACTLADDFGDFVLDISFEHRDGKTVVTEVNTQGKNMPSWSKVMLFTFSGMIAEGKQGMYNNLKSLVEQE